MLHSVHFFFIRTELKPFGRGLTNSPPPWKKSYSKQRVALNVRELLFRHTANHYFLYSIPWCNYKIGGKKKNKEKREEYYVFAPLISFKNHSRDGSHVHCQELIIDWNNAAGKTRCVSTVFVINSQKRGLNRCTIISLSFRRHE